MTINIKTFFDSDTATFTHVVSDADTQKCAIIDSVLDYDQYSGKTSTKSADQVIAYIKEAKLSVAWILDTHIHADHITASYYLKKKLGGKIGIGAKIKDVLALWVPIFNTSKDTNLDASQFDHLFEDGEVFKLGNVDVKTLHTPGHTPACSSYLIEDAIFVGDTIFMPDLGTARTDFPGGSAAMLYDSIKIILSLPDETRIFLCHDYPPEGRGVTWLTTVKDQKAKNILIHDDVSKEEYVNARNKRNEGKAVPKLLLPSIQANLRAGTFGLPESNNISYIKIPVNAI
ncbi:MBL fold metallo-hydrolase [Rickettsiales endosymbiont of Paramecium tredecaurelia]|uniref:MBL fold metallo-hydrolase n=1 Tax=Candidatus Sarmatiella mevalonica TaxID=2770581 RepID=UPI001A914880|nr:MBL fold metallo-hydrolase [Candidatus Sarmatiella mevalonica]MBL3284492.1 MBL fold metallo-hydrolase [Candidatus Sarmatiella mevalonica]